MQRTQKIGRYQILEQIGGGGMGVVYRAMDSVLGREVAVKTLRVDIARDTGLRERFFREARSAGALSHHDIVTIFERGEDNGTPYLVMELLEGEDLKTRLERAEPLPTDERLRIALEVARGLAHAHTKGIVHRDIKPSNVFLCKSGQVKILDFGLAHIASSELTRTGQILGTPNYMAPEQILSQSVDPRTDIFSFGALLYELLAGRKAFPGNPKEFAALSFVIVTKEPEPIERIVPDLPEALRRMVRKAMAKSPAARYQSLEELVQELEHFLPSTVGHEYAGRKDCATTMAGRADKRARDLHSRTTCTITRPDFDFFDEVELPSVAQEPRAHDAQSEPGGAVAPSEASPWTEKRETTSQSSLSCEPTLIISPGEPLREPESTPSKEVLAVLPSDGLLDGLLAADPSAARSEDLSKLSELLMQVFGPHGEQGP